MKKTILAVILTLGAAVYVSALSGIIREMSGDVTFKVPGASDFVPAYIGRTFTSDTIVNTGFRSMAIIEVGSATLSLRPLSRISLMQAHTAAGTETVTTGLQAGRVRVDVRPPAGAVANFTIQGPSATASVRGTSFEFDQRSVRVIEGSVRFFAGAISLGNLAEIAYDTDTAEAAVPADTAEAAVPADAAAVTAETAPAPAPTPVPTPAMALPTIVQAGGESVVAAGRPRAADPVQSAIQIIVPSAPPGSGASGETTVAPTMPSATGNVIITITLP